MKILLVVDLQKQFKVKGYEKCLEYIENHRDDYDKVVATLFVNDKNINSNFVRKLGYRECQNAAPGDIEFKADQIFIKRSYAIPWGVFSIKDHVDIIGCETDACVLATCFSLWDDGIDFDVLWEYVYTSAAIKEKELRRIFKRNFGI